MMMLAREMNGFGSLLNDAPVVRFTPMHGRLATLLSFFRAGESISLQRQGARAVFPISHSAPLELLGNLLGTYLRVRI